VDWAGWQTAREDEFKRNISATAAAAAAAAAVLSRRLHQQLSQFCVYARALTEAWIHV